jgi:chemotaxis-related protein WspB
VLALAFHIGPDRFALGCADVVEVVPRDGLRAIPHAPAFVPGLFTYRGAVVPVVDLSLLMRGTPSADKLSTRIVLVRLPTLTDKLLGLLAERVLDTVTLDEKASVPAGIDIPDAPYLGDVFFDGGSTVQLVRIERLLAGPLRALLTGDPR